MVITTSTPPSDHFSPNSSPSELLLAKVKSNNVVITQTETQIMDRRKEIESSKKQLLEVSSQSEGADQQKYEVLFSKDQEMSKFLDSFPQVFADEKQRVSEKQAEVGWVSPTKNNASAKSRRR